MVHATLFAKAASKSCMKNIITVLLLLPLLSANAQSDKKVSFIVLAGITKSSKTNLQNSHYNIYYYYKEKAFTGMSAQFLASFRLGKSWHINTGIAADSKGFATDAIQPGPADGPMPSHYNSTGYYTGIAAAVEKTLFTAKKFRLSVDAGCTPQWRTFASDHGKDLLSSQFTLTGGLYGKFALGKMQLLAHPVYRHSLTQIQDARIGGPSPSFQAYSAGLELGIQF